MFERMTDRARRVVVLAQEEARLLNHNYIGTEHILLGLVHEGGGVAARALEALGISLEEVRQQVEEIVGAGQFPPRGHIPFTPQAKKVLELSLRETLDLGHQHIGTEHILLGLIREGEDVAARVLVNLGGDLGRVRQHVIQILSGYTGEPTPPSVEHVGTVAFEVASETVSASLGAEMGPRCSQCRRALTETLVCRVLDVREEGADRDHPALVVYCGACGATLGVLPSPNAV